MKTNWFKINIKLFIHFVNNLIEIGRKETLVNFFIYLKQGFWCKDCRLSCYDCECNKCEYCKYNICLCDFMFQEEKYYRNIIFLITKFVIKNLSKKQINQLIRNLDLDILQKGKYTKIAIDKLKREVEINES